MTVYVDLANLRCGRMIMCHMMADTEAELHGMADAIGVDRRRFHRGHYNICRAKREIALEKGAEEVSSRFLVNLRSRQQ